MRSRVAFVIWVSVLIVACGKRPQPVIDELLCDPSSSSICDETVVRAAVDGFLDENNPPGSLFEVWTLGCDVGDVAKVYSIQIPPSWGKGVAKRKKEWLLAERARLKGLVLPPIGQCSAVSAGIWSVAQLLKEHGGFTRRLRVLSDLREVYGPFNFERRVPAPKRFVDWLRKKNLLADLRGVEVEVCLVHNRRTPNSPGWDAEKSEQRDAAWTEVFAAMGARGVPLNVSCSFGQKRSDLVAGGPLP
jgi:hypothetical protein